MKRIAMLKEKIAEALRTTVDLEVVANDGKFCYVSDPTTENEVDAAINVGVLSVRVAWFGKNKWRDLSAEVLQKILPPGAKIEYNKTVYMALQRGLIQDHGPRGSFSKSSMSPLEIRKIDGLSVVGKYHAVLAERFNEGETKALKDRFAMLGGA